MSIAIEITYTPGDGILTVSAETIAALDNLATTLPADVHGWRIDVRLPAATLTATPANHRQETQP